MPGPVEFRFVRMEDDREIYRHYFDDGKMTGPIVLDIGGVTYHEKDRSCIMLDHRTGARYRKVYLGDAPDGCVLESE